MNWELVVDVFGEALEHEVESRDRFVRERCANHESEYREVLRLLQLHRDDEFLRPPEPEALPPPPYLGADRRLGDFELIEEIGSGATARVFRARQVSLEREVALKVLEPESRVSRSASERFRRGASAAARLEHPNVVPIFSVDEQHGVHFFAMGLIRGETLEHRLERARVLNEAGDFDAFGELRIAWVARVVEKIARALEVAHVAGLVHRDVKPGNVLIDEEGEPHVVDFGLAHELDRESLDQTGMLYGTPFYMSPEQVGGDSSGIDARTDVFAIGVVLYEMLTLERPFDGANHFELIRAIERSEPVPVRERRADVPRDLEVVCHKALEKDPKRRYQSARELADDLERFRNHRSIRAKPPTLADQTEKFLRRRRVEVVVVAIVLALLVAVFLVTWTMNERERLEREIAPIERFVDSGWRFDLSELKHVQRAIDRLDPQHLSTARTQLVADARTKLADVRTELESRMGRVLERGFEAAAFSVGSDEEDAPSLGDVVLGALVGEERNDPESLNDLLNPRLTIDTEPGATVRLFRNAPSTGVVVGDPIELGSEVKSKPIPPGYYRIHVRAPDGRSNELTRVIVTPRKGHEFTVPLRAIDEVTRDMVLVASGPFVFGMGENDENYGEGAANLADAFWIDRSEVSNAEYRRFVEETGYPPPRHWKGRYDASWGPLPVVNVSADDAEAYALWAGKRLPTAWEWQRAARDTDGRRYPWGSDGTDLANRAVIGPSDITQAIGTGRYDDAVWSLYASKVMAVDIETLDRSPVGMLHSLGNVKEWTETRFREAQPDGTTLVIPRQRLILGGSWTLPPELCQLVSYSPAPASLLEYSIGFRCARSADRQ